MPQFVKQASIASRLTVGIAAVLVALVLPLSNLAGAGSTAEPMATAQPSPTAVSSATAVPATAVPAAAPVAAPRVGIQVGHWKPWEAPPELSRLSSSIGAFHDNWGESIVNLDVAKRVADILQQEGVKVDLLPVTIPPDYRADVFVAIHGDANQDKKLSGFKISHADWSGMPELEDTLVGDLAEEYQAATGLKEHRATITDNMREYYAFNHRFEHSVDRGTPAAILEMGFLTNDQDRKLLLDEQDRVAQGVAKGILRFLQRDLPKESRLESPGGPTGKKAK